MRNKWFVSINCTLNSHKNAPHVYVHYDNLDACSLKSVTCSHMFVPCLYKVFFLLLPVIQGGSILLMVKVHLSACMML